MRCEHQVDNQGFCHNCGKPINREYYEAYAGKISNNRWNEMVGYWEVQNVNFDLSHHMKHFNDFQKELKWELDTLALSGPSVEISPAVLFELNLILDNGVYVKRYSGE